jgi:hypothetical protein
MALHLDDQLGLDRRPGWQLRDAERDARMLTSIAE